MYKNSDTARAFNYLATKSREDFKERKHFLEYLKSSLKQNAQSMENDLKKGSFGVFNEIKKRWKRVARREKKSF